MLAIAVNAEAAAAAAAAMTAAVALLAAGVRGRGGGERGARVRWCTATRECHGGKRWAEVMGQAGKAARGGGALEHGDGRELAYSGRVGSQGRGLHQADDAGASQWRWVKAGGRLSMLSLNCADESAPVHCQHARQ